MANQLVGTIVHISPFQSLTSKSGSTFTKRELVIAAMKFDPNTGEPYSDETNTPVFSFMGDKGSELDHFAVGQQVKVSFDIIGRSYDGRYFNDVRGYKVEAYGNSCTQTINNNVPQSAPQVPAQPNMAAQTDENDPFPF